MLLKHSIMCTSILALLKKDTKSVYRYQNRPRLSPGYQPFKQVKPWYNEERLIRCQCTPYVFKNLFEI